jgi:carboxyl-terminal processing protease
LKFDKKFLFTILFIIAFSAAAMFVYAQEHRRENVLRDMDRFAQVLEKILESYVDELESEELIDAAIKAMLDKLDPHSVYLTRHQLENLMIDTRGEFGGLGITITIRDKFPTVISPIEDTPAHRLGIQAGDRFVEIEGESTEGWSSEEAVGKLRGDPGTQVNVTVTREGLEDSLYYTITREIIKVPSITYSDRLDGVGYIRVSRFAERTAGELDDIVDDFEDEGIDGLILDLRSNPGGLLDAAREVSELFLGRDTLIVYTESRIPSHEKKFASRARNIHGGYPIVVLVNGYSASASEIVAGALQDWDRAVIVGQPTFGKASVQTVFRIGSDSALKLTTAKYFTPTGRSIHKDEPAGDDSDDIATISGEEAEKRPDDISEREVFYTAGGRMVYGGGGITPDWILEVSEYTDLQRELELKGIFFSYAVHYTAYNEADENFEVDDEVLADFTEFLKTKDITVEEDQWTEENIDYVKLSIKREVFRKLYGTKGAYIATLMKDEEIIKVLEMFRSSSNLKEMFVYVEEQNEKREVEEQSAARETQE